MGCSPGPDRIHSNGFEVMQGTSGTFSGQQPLCNLQRAALELCQLRFDLPAISKGIPLDGQGMLSVSSREREVMFLHYVKKKNHLSLCHQKLQQKSECFSLCPKIPPGGGSGKGIAQGMFNPRREKLERSRVTEVMEPLFWHQQTEKLREKTSSCTLGGSGWIRSWNFPSGKGQVPIPGWARPQLPHSEAAEKSPQGRNPPSKILPSAISRILRAPSCSFQRLTNLRMWF